jgi:hypothetical protein
VLLAASLRSTSRHERNAGDVLRSHHRCGTAGAGNALFFNAPINGNTTVQWTGSYGLTAGDFIQVKGSTGITFNVSGGIA